MSQTDWNLANQSGANFRAELNNILQSIAELQSGASEPSTTFAYMWWADTTNNVLKQRNSGNTAWNIRATLDNDVVLGKSANYSIQISDYNKTVNCDATSGTFKVFLPPAASAGEGFEVTVKKVDSTAAPVTIEGDATAETIDGSVTYDMDTQYESVILICDGADWYIKNTSGVAPTTTAALMANSLYVLIHPDTKEGWAPFYRQRVTPAFFNQQWGGGAYGGLPDGSLGEVATGYISEISKAFIADTASRTYQAQGFKVSQNTNTASIWIKLYKVGNPANNLELYIYDDSAGSPNALITNGTATAQSGRLHTDNTDGEWVKFTFPVAPTLTANTQYHIVCKSSGAVDASNYWCWVGGSYKGSYPHGYINTADATPTWSASAGFDFVFLVEPVTSILRSGGLFDDGKLSTFEGSPLNQSGAFNLPHIYADINHKLGMFHIAGTGFTASKTLMDSGVGIDNNRIRLSINGSGFPVVELWEDDETKHIVTGTTDVTTGNHIISYGYRAENDGSDYLKLYVDGASEGTEVTAASIELNVSFNQDGNTILGGGFPAAPTWTDEETMSALPSAGAYTFAGTATEASAFSVNGGILYQTGSGYVPTDAGYYTNTVTLNNSTGWVVATKLKVKNNTDTVASGAIRLQIQDGSKILFIDFHEYYIEADGGPAIYAQLDMTQPHTITAIGKGSDYYIFVDGKLLIDGTGQLTAASATNQIDFGDIDTTSVINADAEWYYVKHYEGAFLPEFNACELSEVAYWSEDKSALLPTIYNSGTIQSVKELAGMNNNYVREVERVYEAKGIGSSPSTTSTALVPLDDLQLFVFGASVDCLCRASTFNNTVNDSVALNTSIDGRNKNYNESVNTNLPANSVVQSIVKASSRINGLSFISAVWKVSGNTGSADGTRRSLTVEVK